MNHEIVCLNKKCIGGRIETTMEGDSGYSNWTVLDDGYVEFKCHGCGRFASTDTFKKPNNPDNFQVTCNVCGSTNWSACIQDVEGEEGQTHIVCDDCGVKSTSL